MNDQLRDIKYPINIPYPWYYWVLLVLAIVLLAALVYYIKQKLQERKKPEEQPAEPEDTRTPEEIAGEALAELENMKVESPEEVKAYYVRISEIIRRFLEQKYATAVMEATTTEIMDLIQNNNWQKQDLIEKFLEDSDIVKFAKYLPGKNEMRAIMGVAKEIVG
ncbi:MAG: DUF4381 family protein [Candidatus Margulisiibacteriota bacterium]